MGYSETSKAYQTYIPSLLSVVVRWDVNFEEERAFRRSQDLGDKESSVAQQSPSQVTGAHGTGGHGSRGTSASLVGP